MKLTPPRLTRGPLSGAIFVVTHGRVLGHDKDGREIIESSVKYDVTEQYEALRMSKAQRAMKEDR